MSNVVGAMRLFKENVKLNIYNPTLTESGRGVIGELLEAIESWDRELKATILFLEEAGDPLPKGVIYFTSALVLVMYMEAYRLIGLSLSFLSLSLSFLSLSLSLFSLSLSAFYPLLSLSLSLSLSFCSLLIKYIVYL